MSIDEKVETPKKVLYVDDDKLISRSLELYFRNDKKIDFKVVNTKEEGLKMIAKNNYDIVLTDGVLGYAGHGNEHDTKEAMKRDGLEIAKVAKEKGAYVIGFSTKPDYFSDVALQCLDINIRKPAMKLQKLKELLYETPIDEETKQRYIIEIAKL